MRESIIDEKTYNRLLQILGSGQTLTVYRGQAKGGNYFILKSRDKEYNGKTICSAINGLHESLFVSEEITVNGKVYVLKESQP